MMKYYVYGLIDPRTDQPFYIGKGQIRDKLNRQYRRIRDHLDLVDKNNRFKNCVIKKISKIGMEIKHIIYEEFLHEEDAFNKEVELIKKYGRRNIKTGILTNLTDGGEGFVGYVHSEESKLKMSNYMKEYYKNNPVNFKGEKHTEESRKKISSGLKEYYKLNGHPSIGTKRTKEHRKNQSERQRGKIRPKEICYKFASHGVKNCFAKSYTFISPTGEDFLVNGEFKKFIRNNNLSLDTCKKFVNSGIIPPPINPNHNRLTQDRINTTGWSIIKH